MANPNLKEETICEKSTSQKARGLQNARVKEEKLSPTVGRRKISPENAPLVVGRTERQGKLRKWCCGVEVRKTTWGTTRKIQTFPHPPVNVAGKVKAAAGVADRVRALRSYEEARKEPKIYLLLSIPLPSPESWPPPENPPPIAGRTEKGGEA